MDEGRKRTLWVCASIFAAGRLSQLKDAENEAVQAAVTYDAILKAERVINQIDARWPSNRVPGKT
jgi:hypothetical protein